MTTPKKLNLKHFTLLAIGLIIITTIASLLIQNKGKILGETDVKPGNYLVDAQEVTQLGGHYKMVITADSENQPVNAVGLYIDFDPDILQVYKLDTSKSFCQFYPENKYDNARGKIKIACGAPSPGHTGASTIAEIDFLLKNIGRTNITITEQSQILLNDGKGTNIFNGPITKQLTVLNNI